MKQKNYKEYIANTLPCIGYSILTGIFTGIIIFFFKFLAGRVETLSRTLYSFAKESWLTVLLTFLVLAALAFLMSNLKNLDFHLYWQYGQLLCRASMRQRRSGSLDGNRHRPYHR